MVQCIHGWCLFAAYHHLLKTAGGLLLINILIYVTLSCHSSTQVFTFGIHLHPLSLVFRASAYSQSITCLTSSKRPRVSSSAGSCTLVRHQGGQARHVIRVWKNFDTKLIITWSSSGRRSHTRVHISDGNGGLVFAICCVPITAADSILVPRIQFGMT